MGKKTLQAMVAPEAERSRQQRQVGIKVISLDEMRTYEGVRRGDARNSRRIWIARDGIHFGQSVEGL